MRTIFKTSLVVALLLVGLGCGYSRKSNMTTMPTITQLNPADETHGDAQFQLMVVGTNFATNAVVNFNGTPMATTFVSSTSLQATIPASAIMNAGIAQVTVTNPGGGTYGNAPPVTSAAMNFTIS